MNGGWLECARTHNTHFKQSELTDMNDKVQCIWNISEQKFVTSTQHRHTHTQNMKLIYTFICGVVIGGWRVGANLLCNCGMHPNDRPTHHIGKTVQATQIRRNSSVHK